MFRTTQFWVVSDEGIGKVELPGNLLHHKSSLWSKYFTLSARVMQWSQYVNSSSIIEQSFEYLKYKSGGEQHRLSRVLLPLDREIKFSYYTQDEELVAGKKIKMDDSWGPDKRRSRVKTLSSSGAISHSFRYDLKPPYRKITSVYDADHNLTEYHFGKDLRLWELKRYSPEKTLLNREEYETIA